MRLFGWIVTLSVSVLLCLASGAAPKEKLVVVNGPTVVAFFPPVTGAELAKDPDTNESLADFQLYATRVREKLNNAGIEFQVIHASSFVVRCEAKTTTFRPKKNDGRVILHRTRKVTTSRIWRHDRCRYFAGRC